jgi:hypothetical protein
MIQPDLPERGPHGLAARLPPRLVRSAATARRWAFDAALAAAVIGAEIGSSYGAMSWHHKHVAPGILAYLILAAGGAALLARRRYPVAVLAVTLVSALGRAGWAASAWSGSLWSWPSSTPCWPGSGRQPSPPW